MQTRRSAAFSLLLCLARFMTGFQRELQQEYALIINTATLLL